MPPNRLRRRHRRSKCDNILEGEINLSPKSYIKIFIFLVIVLRFAYSALFKNSSSDYSTTSAVVGATIDFKTQKHDWGNIAKEKQVQAQAQLHSKPKEPMLIDNSFDRMLPSKPLRPLNLEIVSRTHSVDLSFVDVSEDGLGSQDHPHLGGLDEDGKYGYVFNELSLQMNPPKFQRVDEEGDACENNKDGNYKMLTNRVSIDFAGHEAAEANAKVKGAPERAKIMCIVYTIEAHHSRITPIQQTWGQRCDGFIAISDKTDPILGTVNVPHEGDEEYGNIWQKIRSAWSYVYDNYYEMYDWFHIGGDDLYVLVENLRLYLESEEIQLAANGGKVLPNTPPTSQYPLFLGRRFKEQGNEQRIFNSGGSGYTLNKAALKSLVVDGMPKCMPHHKTFAEDVMVAACLRNQFKVFPYDTKDEDGGERYMPFMPAHHLTYEIPEGPTDDWYAKYSIDIKEGLDHCALNSVAFHYIKPKLMKRMHAILYGLCP